MINVIVTKLGAGLKTNKWKEGQALSLHENTANLFLIRGYVVNEGDKAEKKIDLSKGAKNLNKKVKK